MNLLSGSGLSVLFALIRIDIAAIWQLAAATSADPEDFQEFFAVQVPSTLLHELGHAGFFLGQQHLSEAAEHDLLTTLSSEFQKWLREQDTSPCKPFEE